ncbi:MAG: sugar phosphate nucleotidyltransferase, partial [Saprospiraceae bacterium]|nr:sugar phosphate nucleotidyltransferase [Saprospiraceae bacterium]
MKAMIFAAGLGTRLRPFTANTPKALIRVEGMPLLEIIIRRLKFFGFNQLVINVHHFADQIEKFLSEKNNFGLEIYISDERDLLLDTGGGLKKAMPLFESGSFLVCNTDVITNMDLAAFLDRHRRSGALATLAVRDRKSSRYLLFDEKYRLCGWRNEKTAEERLCRTGTRRYKYAFSGIQA